MMNGVPLMIRAVQSKQLDQKSPALVAGPRTFAPATKMPLRDLLQEFDPWAQASSGPQSTRSNSSNGTAAVAPVGPARQVDAPTASKFQAIEARLNQFETDMSLVKDGQTRLAKELESNVMTTKAIDGKVTGMQQHLQSAVEQAIGAAMTSQTKALESRFENLMKMMRAPPPDKSTKRDRTQQRDGSDAEMESPGKPGARP